jgi:hypothetical protein
MPVLCFRERLSLSLSLFYVYIFSKDSPEQITVIVVHAYLTSPAEKNQYY